MGVMAGQYQVVIAGGVEHMTRVPMGSNAVGPGDGPLSPKLQARFNSLVDAARKNQADKRFSAQLRGVMVISQVKCVAWMTPRRFSASSSRSASGRKTLRSVAPM